MTMKCDFCGGEFPESELETVSGARRGSMRTPGGGWRNEDSDV